MRHRFVLAGLGLVLVALAPPTGAGRRSGADARSGIELDRHSWCRRPRACRPLTAPRASIGPLFRFSSSAAAGSNAKFRSPRDGFGFAVIDENNFRFGPVAKLKRERREGSDSALRGLGNVDWAVEVGAYAEYWWMPWLRTRAELRNGIGGHHGLVADLSADAVYNFAPRWTLAGGPRMTLVSAAANDPYFSITAAQSVASGLPVVHGQRRLALLRRRRAGALRHQSAMGNLHLSRIRTAERRRRQFAAGDPARDARSGFGRCRFDLLVRRRVAVVG